MRMPSRRFLPMTTVHAHLESLISLTRELRSQGDRQKGLHQPARGTGIEHCVRREGAWRIGQGDIARSACLKKQPLRLKFLSRLSSQRAWRSLTTPPPTCFRIRCKRNHLLGNQPPNAFGWQKHSRQPLQPQTQDCLGNRHIHLRNKDMLPNVAGFSSSVVLYQTVVQMTGLLRDTALNKAKTTHECLMDSQSLTRSGGAAVTAAWTWPWTSTRGPFLNQWCHVRSVIASVANKFHSESAYVATTG
eukprot:1563728-Amphidinium_carterae.1